MFSPGTRARRVFRVGVFQHPAQVPGLNIGSTDTLYPTTPPHARSIGRTDINNNLDHLVAVRGVCFEGFGQIGQGDAVAYQW